MMANAFWSGPDDVSNAKPDDAKPDAKPGGQKGCVFLIRLLLPLAGWNSSSPNTASFGPSVVSTSQSAQRPKMYPIQPVRLFPWLLRTSYFLCKPQCQFSHPALTSLS